MFDAILRLFRRPADAAPLTFHPTETCAHCGSRLTQSETGWICPNPDCPPRIIERIAHWPSPAAMDIPGFDDALIRQLVTNGLVLDAADFYRLKLAELAALDGMDQSKARAICDGITASRKRDAWRTLHGLLIPGVSVQDARQLCERFSSLDELFAAGRNRLATLGCVSPACAAALVRWHDDPVNRRLLNRLRKAGVNFDTR